MHRAYTTGATSCANVGPAASAAVTINELRNNSIDGRFSVTFANLTKEVVMRRLVGSCCLAVLAFVISPTTAFAQATGIAGVVKDTSGAVLPGVTVEAASPALIERTRSATTDSQGQYRIESLQPGAYTVTFTLAGF